MLYVKLQQLMFPLISKARVPSALSLLANLLGLLLCSMVAVN
jgi:hypothetical protein